MQTLPAAELKRRGVAALDDLLPHGPVQLIRNNRPAAVVLSVEEYARLKSADKPVESVLEWLRNRPPPTWTPRSREQIDRDLRAERDSWGEP
jgi:PHD/YefM family antitoxin component YafN of YafNO toxin-antitoxin module